jgi:hypothetical protein
MWILLALVCMVISLFVFTFILYSYSDEGECELITCVMITGGDATRAKLVKSSIDNFREQTHRNKHLLIINHGDTQVPGIDMMYNVTEVKTVKGRQTLGDMRNMAFEYVPYNGLFCVWDDDDYRSASFLDVLYKALRRSGTSAVCFTNRLEYNMNNMFAWETYWSAGFVHVLARKHYKVQYDNLDSMEDLVLLERMRSVYSVHTIDNNDARMYVRLIHATNTSLYVDKGKDALVGKQRPHWNEHALTPKYRDYIDKVYVPKL